MGLTVEKPTGAFYLFPYVGHLTSSSFDFALDLVKEAGLAVVPGTAFSEYGEGYLRLSYAYSIETLKEGCDRLEAFLMKKLRVKLLAFMHNDHKFDVLVIYEE